MLKHMLLKLVILCIVMHTESACNNELQYWQHVDHLAVESAVPEDLQYWQEVGKGSSSFAGLLTEENVAAGYFVQDDVLFYNGYLCCYLCKNEEVYYIPEGIRGCYNGAFQYAGKLKDLHIPASCIDIGNNASGLYVQNDPMIFDVENIFVDDKNPLLCDNDGVLFSKNQRVLLCYPAKRTADHYCIPDGVEIISRFSFIYACLQNVYFPRSLRYIGNEAFRNSEIKSVQLADTNTIYISDSAFQCCAQLSEISFPETLLYIGSYAFAECPEIAAEITLPSSLLYLESYAFFISPVQKIFYHLERLQYKGDDICLWEDAEGVLRAPEYIDD